MLSHLDLKKTHWFCGKYLSIKNVYSPCSIPKPEHFKGCIFCTMFDNKIHTRFWISMVDIHQYRICIGNFCGGRHSPYSGLGSLDSWFHPMHHLSTFAFCLTYLVLVGLSYPCAVNDPRIESNPGPPHPNSKSWESDALRKLYFSAKKTNSDIAQVSCHRFFINPCRSVALIWHPDNDRSDKSN